MKKIPAGMESMTTASPRTIAGDIPGPQFQTEVVPVQASSLTMRAGPSGKPMSTQTSCIVLAML